MQLLPWQKNITKTVLAYPVTLVDGGRGSGMTTLAAYLSHTLEDTLYCAYNLAPFVNYRSRFEGYECLSVLPGRLMTTLVGRKIYLLILDDVNALDPSLLSRAINRVPHTLLLASFPPKVSYQSSFIDLWLHTVWNGAAALGWQAVSVSELTYQRFRNR